MDQTSVLSVLALSEVPIVIAKIMVSKEQKLKSGIVAALVYTLFNVGLCHIAIWYVMSSVIIVSFELSVLQ
jgi:hypothetical protein